MILLLTILSILAVFTLLLVLVFGLLLILKPLQSVRAHLEKIAMGVRAIEREMAPFEAHIAGATESFGKTAERSHAAAQRLSQVDRSLDRADPLFSSQS